MNRGKSILVALLYLCGILTCAGKDLRQYIDLSGIWSFELDQSNTGIKDCFWSKDLNDRVKLPGSTDSNRKGEENRDKSETNFLSRYFKYEGVAWYSRDVTVPEEWAGKRIFLFLERTRPSMVWVDEKEIGACNYLSSPHQYELTDYLKPGVHRITIRIDNGESIPKQVRSNSHACAEATQTNWNGIIGRMELQAVNREGFIENVQVYPDASRRMVKVRVHLSDGASASVPSLSVVAHSFNSSRKHSAALKEIPLEEGRDEYEFEYLLGDNALLWSDVDPALYRLFVRLGNLDNMTVSFGLRDFKPNGNHFTINGTKTFLRGKHDACVFPLTGYTAMDIDAWRRYFRILKEYGLNHCRFHSWCPPESCFEAADMEGIYLQIELPFWGSFENAEARLFDFLLNDGDNMMREYSNHASFVMFALGNELSGDIDIMESLLKHFREVEPRHLYTYGSNVFLGIKGHIPGEDFLVTCRVGEGEGYSTHVRASFSYADADEGGYLNNTYPNTKMNFDNAAKRSAVPVVGHETGQFQIYPNYKEINKYTGVLAPWNFEVFRDRLKQKGMLGQADDFFRASGMWAVELYRADIEMNLRSESMAGFQLLDLQDYPGQGSAYVGILDAFMDTKGLISPEKWREFCCEVVPLLEMQKYCWTGGESFNGNIEVANYGGTSLSGKKLSWRLHKDGRAVAQGETALPDGMGLLRVGEISFSFPQIDKACKVELELLIKGTPYKNSYPMWIYPQDIKPENGKVMVVRSLTNDVRESLNNGARVLWIPNESECRQSTVEGLFQTDYWNYRMFKSICDNLRKPVSPGTLGILTDPDHSVFKNFPTEFHTNWQWYSIIRNSFPLILDAMPDHYRPIVQVIDNVERNHKLGLLFEMKIGAGKLMVCMVNLEKASDTPEGRQFYSSILKYMNSSAFNPEMAISIERLEGMLQNQSSGKDNIKILKNVSYE